MNEVVVLAPSARLPAYLHQAGAVVHPLQLHPGRILLRGDGPVVGEVPVVLQALLAQHCAAATDPDGDGVASRVAVEVPLGHLQAQAPALHHALQGVPAAHVHFQYLSLIRLSHAPSRPAAPGGSQPHNLLGAQAGQPDGLPGAGGGVIQEVPHGGETLPALVQREAVPLELRPSAVLEQAQVEGAGVVPPPAHAVHVEPQLFGQAVQFPVKPSGPRGGPCRPGSG